MYLVPAISAGFFVISHTPGYTNPSNAQLHCLVFDLGSFQRSPLLYPDIIGEKLESIEESHPADDWSVLQQNFAAARRRKKAAAFAWAGGITSVAAAIALVLLLVRPDEPFVITV